MVVVTISVTATLFWLTVLARDKLFFLPPGTSLPHARPPLPLPSHNCLYLLNPGFNPALPLHKGSTALCDRRLGGMALRPPPPDPLSSTDVSLCRELLPI